MARDFCKGLRKTYTACIQCLSRNPWIAFGCIGLPVYYLSGFIIAQHTRNINVANIFASPSYIILAILLISWLVAGITLWKSLPNLLTVCKFVFSCLAHWSLVSFCILIFYGISVLPAVYMQYLAAVLLPAVILLIVSSDVMRTVRTNMFAHIESTAPIQV